VISLTKTAAQQLATHNINVNSVCPGVKRTALSDDNLRVRAQQEGVTMEDMERRRVAAIPLKRANDPGRISPRWWCSWRLTRPGTSPGNPSTWMEVSSRIRPRPMYCIRASAMSARFS
jgi:NAD(P)-dependent dehydrogenase (short-subunit alcohol dehydrogenase family)